MVARQAGWQKIVGSLALVASVGLGAFVIIDVSDSPAATAETAETTDVDNEGQGEAAGPINGMSAEEIDYLSSWNVIGDEPLPPVSPSLTYRVTDDNYEFTMTPGIDTAEDNLPWLGQSWASAEICQDDGLPFARDLEPQDVETADGKIHSLRVSQVAGSPGCWQVGLGHEWNLMDGLVYNNPEHPNFQNYGFPYPDLTTVPPSELLITVPHDGDGGEIEPEDARPEGSVSAGRVVDRPLTPGSNAFTLLGRSGPDEGEYERCRWRVDNEWELDAQTQSGAWLLEAYVFSGIVEVPLNWTEQGLGWEDLGWAESFTVEIERPGADAEKIEFDEDDLIPALIAEDPLNQHLQVRQLGRATPTAEGIFATDTWLPPGTKIKASAVVMDSCAPAGEFNIGETKVQGGDGLEGMALAWLAAITRPAERAEAQLRASE